MFSAYKHGTISAYQTAIIYIYLLIAQGWFQVSYLELLSLALVG